MPGRLTARRDTLDVVIGVRFPTGQPKRSYKAGSIYEKNTTAFIYRERSE